MDQYNYNTNKTDIPDDCCTLNMGLTHCEFVDASERNNIKLQLYDGGISKHPYWGNLAFDLDSMTLAKKKVPILIDHNPSERLGYSTGVDFDGTFTMTGKLLDNENAMSIKKDMEDGFPFESSLRFDPRSTEIIKIEEGNSIFANGKTLKGPGVLFKNARIMEGSVCTFGALNNCKSELFNKEQKPMSTETKPITIDIVTKEAPEVFKEIQGAGIEQGTKEGHQEAKERIREFKEAFGDDPEFCLEQIESDVSFTEAMKAYCQKLKNKNTELSKNKPIKDKEKVKEQFDPAIQEFSDDTSGQEKTAVGETGWRSEFESSAELQSEFLDDPEKYVAFKKAEKNGQINMLIRE